MLFFSLLLIAKNHVKIDMLQLGSIFATGDPPGSPASSSGALSTGQTWTCWTGARGGHKNDPRAGTPLLGGKAERVGVVQPGEEQAPERLH